VIFVRMSDEKRVEARDVKSGELGSDRGIVAGTAAVDQTRP
jgi:hypothetical protein